MPSVGEDTPKATAELIREDPGKASDLIQKFNAVKDTTPKPKERLGGNKFSEDRLSFLSKKTDESTPVHQGPDRGVKPGGGDKKWLKKIEEEEAARKGAANSKANKDDAVTRLQAELDSAALECTERSRLLTNLREKYQMLTVQLNDLQDMLGLANGARIKMLHNEKKAQRKDAESEADRKQREAEEKEALRSQASEMRDKLNELMASDARRIELQEEMDKMKIEFEVNQQDALSEVRRLTEIVSSLNDRISADESEWKLKASGLEDTINQLNEEIDKQKEDILQKERQLQQLEKTVAEAETLTSDLGQANEVRQTLEKELESRETNFKQQLELKEEQISSLSSSLEQSKAEVETLTSKVSLVESTTKEYEELQEKLEDDLAKARERTQLMDKTLLAKEVESQTLQTQIDDQKKKIGCIEAALKRARETETEQEALIKDLTQIRIEFGEEIESLKSEIEKLTAKVESQKQEDEASKIRITELEEERRHAVKELSIKDDALMAIKEENARIEETMKALEKQKEIAQADLAALRAEALSIQQEIEVSAKEAEFAERTQAAQAEEWAKEKLTLETSIADLESTKSQINSERQVLETKLNQAEQAKQEAERKLEAVTEENVNECARLVSDLKTLQITLDASKSHLSVAEDERTGLQAELLDVQRSRDLAEESLRHTKGLLDEECQKCAEVTARVEELEKGEESLLTKLKEIEDQIAREGAEALSRYQELEKEGQTRIDNLERQHQTDRQTLTDELTSLSAELTHLSTELSAKERTMSNLAKEHATRVNDLTEKADTLTLERAILLDQHERVLGEKDQEIYGLNSRLSEFENQINGLKQETEALRGDRSLRETQHIAEKEQIKLAHEVDVQERIQAALRSSSDRLRSSLMPEKQVSTEVNVLALSSTPEPSPSSAPAPSISSNEPVPNTFESGADLFAIPPSVSGIDEHQSAEDGNYLRGPSLQTYVETLNAYREQMATRDTRFSQRLTKMRQLEMSIRRRESELNDRIEKVKIKEAQMFSVVRTLKEREFELKSVSESFEKFRNRLQNSCWDQSAGQNLNRTLERPTSEEERNLLFADPFADESSPTFLSGICPEDGQKLSEC